MKKYYDGKVGKKKMLTSLKVHASVLKANKKRGASCSKWSGPYILENIKKTMVSTFNKTLFNTKYIQINIYI